MIRSPSSTRSRQLGSPAKPCVAHRRGAGWGAPSRDYKAARTSVDIDEQRPTFSGPATYQCLHRLEVVDEIAERVVLGRITIPDLWIDLGTHELLSVETGA